MANIVLLKSILGSTYRIASANSGKEAIAQIALSSFDLILLDIMMPGMDGFETLQSLRKLPNFGNTPVIFLTASQDHDTELTGLSMGAADYITKPLHVERVRLRVANVLQRVQLQRQVGLALDSAELGLWELDVHAEQIRIDPRRGILLDLPIPGQSFNTEVWHSVMHPNSRPIFTEALQSVLGGSSQTLDVDVQLKNRAGEWVWATVYGKPTARAANGHAVHLMGTYRNIQQRKLTEAARAESEERLRLVMEATGEGVWDWQIATNLITHNASWCKLLDLDEAYLEHDVEFFRNLIHPDDQERVENALVSSIGGGTPYASEHRLRKQNGDYIWVLDRGKVVRQSDEGVALRMLGSIRDITAQKNAESQVQQLAYYDYLTGLPNRRLLVDRMAHVIAANNRSHGFSALMFIDMDHFKQLNDSFGHDAGDALLTQVGARLKRSVRESDTVARLGGDEFVVMLHSVGATFDEASRNALGVGEKILTALNENYPLEVVMFHSTPSIGLAIFSGAPATVECVLKRADDAMYQAKASGRNCLKMSDEPLDEACHQLVSVG